jgi:hypothetical protein
MSMLPPMSACHGVGGGCVRAPRHRPHAEADPVRPGHLRSFLDRISRAKRPVVVRGYMARFAGSEADKRGKGFGPRPARDGGRKKREPPSPALFFRPGRVATGQGSDCAAGPGPCERHHDAQQLQPPLADAEDRTRNAAEDLVRETLALIPADSTRTSAQL